MKSLLKFALATATVGGIGLTALVPAHAGFDHWCDNHPRRCANGVRLEVGAPAAVVAAPAVEIGAFIAGHGYWDGHRYWAHREGFAGHWRFR